MTSLDLAVLESLERDLGDREVVREIVRVYLELLPERQGAIAESARTDDPVRLRREAHKLGSASATVGAVGLRGLCHQLESADLDRAGAVFRDRAGAWASSFVETEEALDAWLAAS